MLFALGDSLYLYYKKGKKIPNWYTCFRVLRRGAWSEPLTLVPGDLGGRGPVKNKPILLRDDTICAPASIELEKAGAMVLAVQARFQPIGGVWAVPKDVETVYLPICVEVRRCTCTLRQGSK